MKIKRFVASEMRQAIRLVRDELGADAVILSSRRVEDGIELVAAVDFDAEWIAGEARQTTPVTSPEVRMPEHSAADGLSQETAAGPIAATPAPTLAPAPAPAPAQAQAQAGADSAGGHADARTVAALQRELASMRGLLEEQLSQLTWREFAREHPRRAEVVRHFEQLGLDPDLAREIAENVNLANGDREAWREALLGLGRRLRVGGDEIVQFGGVIALVGPTGVGKTTTLAKLAARYIIRHGRGRVALVNTDTYRIGAQAQLNTLGQLLGVPVYQAEDKEDLAKIIEGQGDKRLVLIDTPGVAPRDGRLAEELQSLAGIEGLRLYLVLAANAARDVLGETLRRFGRVPLAGAILSKFDEAEALGPPLSALVRAGLPLTYLGTGQRVAEDLETARVQRIVSHALALSKRREREPEHAGGRSVNLRNQRYAYNG
ncbi:flagellar biosynthesis protein FlhF [Acidihalobacter aeolianus]|uniref:Flagellar biosynthesis protein FlhF n=1 Tax=Acidihalobacter aeolianus TaxID=2792603 RepID=A0A1D8K6R4_9GAMM|nr:flagellar biosynthesis protein FlhF [Acidihalobacter aeolianus]AOV16644.1 flagellar biosynthesis protein FlhF [Acidihalobacter aeolianus]